MKTEPKDTCKYDKMLGRWMKDCLRLEKYNLVVVTLQKDTTFNKDIMLVIACRKHSSVQWIFCKCSFLGHQRNWFIMFKDCGSGTVLIGVLPTRNLV